MMTAGSMGTRSAATKRLMKEYAELQSSPNYQYTAAPLEDNIFDWHFTIRGPQDSEFENGIYHGRIVLPPQYPYKPPSIYFLTPNGRFELGKKICLSITGYHPETWLPAWGIRTALIALISFMTTEGKDAIGALDYTPEERRILAKKSQSWHCEQCGCKNCDQLLPMPKKAPTPEPASTPEEKNTEEEDAKLAEMLVVSGDKKAELNPPSDTTKSTTNTTTSIPKTQGSEENSPITNINTDNTNVNLTTPPEPVLNITPIPSATPILNNNTVEVNTTSVHQRVPTSSSSSSSTAMANAAVVTEPVQASPSASASASSSTKASSKAASPSASTTASQANLSRTASTSQTNLNPVQEERYKSFIDTLIVIVFGLLALLIYYRVNKETKFWNDLD